MFPTTRPSKGKTNTKVEIKSKRMTADNIAGLIGTLKIADKMYPKIFKTFVTQCIGI